MSKEHTCCVSSMWTASGIVAGFAVASDLRRPVNYLDEVKLPNSVIPSFFYLFIFIYLAHQIHAQLL